MHDGWESVAAAYGIVVFAIVVWMWMILGKLRRNPARERSTIGRER